MRLQLIRLAGVVLSLHFVLNVDCFAAKIEADPHKEYTLTKNRGPWMIMVATFHATGDGEVNEGKTPDQAASELVLELRQLGLPAYKLDYDPQQQLFSVKDRLGRDERRKNLRRVRSICVIAGNYHGIDEKVAQDTLKWIKKLHPKCLRDGVTYRPTPGRPGPLSGAFLTINPMLNPEEVEQRRQDPLLIRLNHGERHSLFENRGEFTLVVARFTGKQVSVKAGQKIPDIKDFLKDNDLDDAGRQARELVAVLNGNYDRRQQNALNNIEAYVWHDRHESIVTVGSFDSPTDPRIAKYREMFGPKYVNVNGAPTYVPAEHLSVEGFGKNRDETRLWVFVPDGQLIRVPRMR